MDERILKNIMQRIFQRFLCIVEGFDQFSGLCQPHIIISIHTGFWQWTWVHMLLILVYPNEKSMYLLIVIFLLGIKMKGALNTFSQTFDYALASDFLLIMNVQKSESKDQAEFMHGTFISTCTSILYILQNILA